jgi:hypothetical protein
LVVMPVFGCTRLYTVYQTPFNPNYQQQQGNDYDKRK